MRVTRVSKEDEPLPEDEADRLITEIARRTREHPDVRRGASVRGTIAFKEVLQGLREIRGRLTRSSLEKAALITLPPRMSTKGDNDSAAAIVSDILKEVLYGISPSRTSIETTSPDKTDGLSPEDIMAALQNLRHQLSEGQTTGQAAKDRVLVVPDRQQKPPGYPAAKAPPPEDRGQWYSLTKKAIEQLMEELEQKLRRGEITEDRYHQERSRLREMLGAASQLDSMSGKELAETLMELMDAKDGQWQKDLSFQDMYVYYHRKGTCEGKQLSPAKQGWYGLKVVIDYLEKRGMLTPTGGQTFTLTAPALDILLENVIAQSWRSGEPEDTINYGNAQASERRLEIRRYAPGDVFRDISVRHTLREIARQRKKLSDVSRRDFRVFTKQHRRLKSDIVLCLDCSGSMGFRQKLIYARLVAGGLARAALEKGGRIGIVAFDDFGRTVMPLTSQKEEVLSYIMEISARGNTNIGNGIKCAGQLLLNEPNHNQKYIVLITDGKATAISEKAFTRLQPARERDMTEEDVVLETRKAASSGVMTSVVHINDDDDKEADKELVQNIARTGRGRVRRISSLEDIRAAMQRGARREYFN